MYCQMYKKLIWPRVNYETSAEGLNNKYGFSCKQKGQMISSMIKNAIIKTFKGYKSRGSNYTLFEIIH